MEVVINIADVAILAMLTWFLIILKGFVKKYVEGKGANLATKEDIQLLTKLSEEVKAEFSRQLESHKQTLQYELQIDTNAAIAFRQKARESLEKVNATLIEIQTYCWDSLAELSTAEHYIPLDELVDKSEENSPSFSFIYFRSKLERLALTEALYLPDFVVRSVKELSSSIGNLGAAEVADEMNLLTPQELDLTKAYESGLEQAKKCQEAIRSELVLRPSRLPEKAP